ncbi:unnamed protein product [Closterium sp. NIES-54]
MPERDRTELISIKATILADGGMTIGVNVSHCLMDGEGMFTFMKIWGMRYRGVRSGTEQQQVIRHDRSLLFGKGVGSKLPHPELKVLESSAKPAHAAAAAAALTAAATETAASHASAATSEAVAATPAVSKAAEAAATAAAPAVKREFPATSHSIFHLTSNQLKALRTVAFGPLDGSSASEPSDPRSEDHPTNHDPQGPTYLQNLVRTAATLRLIAQKIRRSIISCSDAYMRDAIEFLAEQKNLSSVRVGTHFFSGDDIMLTSWVHMGMYDADFGARPWYVGLPRLPCNDGMVVVMEGIGGAEGLDVLLLLESAVSERFNRLWDEVPFWQ